MSEVWRGSTSAEMWAEIEALRRSNAAHVDTIMAALARAEAAEAKLDEQIEAAIALRHDLDTLRDLYGAAEARITAATNECNRMIEAFVFARDGRPNEAGYYAFQSVRAALVEPVGQPPRPTPEETAAMDALVAESERLGMYRENYLTWDALRADVERLNARRVGEPQPPTCAECQDERWVCDRFGHGLCRDPRCVVNRRPCPSCAPTEPGDAP